MADTATEHRRPSAPTSTKDVSPKTDDQQLDENSKENLDEKLDNAVDETFPASDPVSVKITKG